METPTNTAVAGLGPYAYQNWRAADSGQASGDGREVALYSDSRFVGELRSDLGPYEIINSVGFGVEGELKHVLTLRTEFCGSVDGALNRSIELLQKGVTKLDEYVGGSVYDEIAALLALANGVRIQAGPENRWFNRTTDPLGRPVAPTKPSPAFIPPAEGRLRIPAARRTVTLQLGLLPSYPRLAALDAIALARASRSYQEALWVAESDPQLAWLMFVSAIETAAAQWFRTSRAAEPTDSEVLRAVNNDLADLLVARGGDALLDEVARVVAQGMRAGYKFRQFLSKFAPPAPDPRPAEWAATVWTGSKLNSILITIYNHRSKALHESLPFPIPMCDPPQVFGEGETRWLTEKPAGTTGVMGGIWAATDLPMLLWGFQYLVRGALLNWWASMA